MRRPSSRHALVAALAASLAIAAPVAVSAKQPSGCTTGQAKVFFPNPVATGGVGLTDQKDADYADLNVQRVSVQLTDLDGSGFLRGTWATVAGETGDSAYGGADCNFVFTCHDDRFEQVMAYYWVTQSQLYLQSLGFDGETWPLINGDQQRVRINQYGVDNSFATDHPKDEMRFGKGGVDDAEDGEVIIHEYGHSVQDNQVPGFGAREEGGAMGEGFGDYLAATVTASVVGDFQLTCIAEWDATSYASGVPHCLRRLDSTKHYPQDASGEVHDDGELWSASLFQIRGALGAAKADRVILAAHFLLSTTANFKDGSNALVTAAINLGLTAAEVATMRTILANRGFAVTA